MHINKDNNANEARERHNNHTGVFGRPSIQNTAAAIIGVSAQDRSGMRKDSMYMRKDEIEGWIVDGWRIGDESEVWRAPALAHQQ